MMVSENLDLVRSLYAAWNRRDVDEWLSFLAPDIVFRPVPTFTDSQERRGLDAARRWMIEWSEVWADDHTTHAVSIREYGHGVIALLRFTGHARASGVEVAGGIFEVFRFRDGKIASMEDFTDRDEALQAVGLEDEAVSQEAIDAQVRLLYLVNIGELSDEVLHSLFTPDLKLQNPATGVTDGSYEGPAGVRGWIGDFIEAFGPGARIEIEKVIADGDDFVMTRQRCTGEGSRSGAPLELRWMNVMWLRDGKICRMAGYANRHEALKAVGLEE